jgi:hypothetical protein
MTTCGALLGMVVAFLLGLEWRAASGRTEQAASAAQAMRAGWREQNMRALMHLSAVRTMSDQEKIRFKRAGDDLGRRRQALIEIHEDRLAIASLDLQDAQKRRIQMQDSGRYKVYSDRAQAQDLVQLVNEDERAATSQMALYAQALSRIRVWYPISYQSYTASKSVEVGVPVEDRSRTSGTSLKPSPQVPAKPVSMLVAQTRIPPAERAISPPEADLREAVRNPSLTVYADDEPRADEVDSGARKRAEQGIQQTLRRWSSAMVLNDPKAEAAEYAPHMDRYFLRKNVDNAFVEADKAAYLRRGNVTAGFALQGVAIESETGDAADVRLVKDVTWQRATDGATHKLIRSRLHLEKFADGWKITGEQDFR